jgi:PilZ domain-containing protein
MKLKAPPFDVAATADSPDMEPTADVRHQIRYPLRSPVSFTWFSRDGEPRNAKGTSRNIGEGGAYIQARNCPPVGAQIILVFRFPHLPEFARFHQLEMSGQVVRAEVLPNSKGMWGFAVSSAWTIMAASDDLNGEEGDAE